MLVHIESENFHLQTCNFFVFISLGLFFRFLCDFEI